MNKAFFATAFLVLLVVTNAETFEKAKLRGITSKMSTEALFKSMKGSPFGKTLFNMLALKFKTSDGQLDTLVATLNELQANIQNQQGADDQNYASASDALNQAISGEQATIDDASSNLANYQAQLADNQNALAQANQQLSQLQQEQDGLNENLATVAQIRSSEQAAYEQRTSNQETLIAGLQQVLQLFQDQTNNAEVNQDSVAEILGLLNNLVAAFQASIAADTAAEQQAVSDYQNYVVPRQQRLEEIASDIADLTATIAQLEATVAQLQDRVASEQNRLDTAEQLLAQYQQQLQDLTDKYTSNTATRTQQLNLLSVVVQRLTQNADEVQEVLNNA